MTRGLRLLLTGCAVAAAAGGAWAWRDHQQAQARARTAQWMAYLRGPLSQVLEGSSRGRALLEAAAHKPLAKAQRQELAEASLQVRSGYDAAKLLQAGWLGDPFFEPMIGTLSWHQALADAARDWSKVAERKDLIPAALEAERGLRRSLGALLDRQRERVFDQGRLGREQGLEINALLYSLKE
jgi:hypothetical protein